MRIRSTATLYLAVLAATALVMSACGSRANDDLIRAIREAGQQNGQQQDASPVPEAAPEPGDGSNAADLGPVPNSSGDGTGASAGADSGGAASAGSAAANRSSAGGADSKGKPSQPKSAAGAPTSPRSSESAPRAASPTTRTADSTGSGDPADAVRISGADSQGVTKDEIKVGVLAPLSGYAGFLGEVEVDAVKALLFDQNAKGGVRGRKYRIVTADTRFEPATEAVGARRLVEQEKVFALFTTWSDSIAPYVTARGLPNFAFGIAPPAFSSKYPNVYPVGLNTVDAVVQMAYTMTQVLKKPIKSVAILYETANIPWGPWVEYAKKAWEQFGVEVKSIDRFNLSDGDCTQLVLKIQSLKVDFWQVAQSLGWPLCQQAMARQGYTPPQGRGGPYTDDWNWLNQMGPTAAGVYGQTNGVQLEKDRKGQPWPYDPSGIAPAVGHYIETMQKYSPKSADKASINSIWAQSFWAQAKLLNDAVVRQVDALTWKGVNQWIQGQKNWSSGLVSPGSFTPNCKTGGVQVWMFQVEWDQANQTVQESDWRPFGGVVKVPTAVKEAVVPGAGDCYVTAMADAKL